VILVFNARKGYRAAKRPVKTTDTAIRIDETLYPESQILQTYWKNQADYIAALGPTAIDDFWSGLEQRQAATIDKVQFAQALLKDNIELGKQLPDIQTFADADTKALAEFNQQLRDWVQNNSKSSSIFVKTLHSGKLPKPVMANVIGETMAEASKDNLGIVFDNVNDTVEPVDSYVSILAAAVAANRIVTNQMASGKPEAVQKGWEWLQEDNRANTNVITVTPGELKSAWGSVKDIENSISWAEKR
jgi:hypothetical protein